MSNINNTIKNSEWIVDYSGKKTFLPQKLYLHFKYNLNLKITDTGNMFLYDGRIYNKISARETKALIKDYIPVEIRCNKDWEAVWKELCTDKPDMLESEFDSDENIIGFNNGVLNLKTGELHNFGEKYLLTRLVDCNYQPNKSLEDAPVFNKYINELCRKNSEEIDFLLEYIGGILSNVQGWRFKKLLILVGEGNTGKTQIREFTMNLLGREHCVSIDMRKLNERFGPAQLYRKRLAGSGDMSTVEISEMNIIKNLTGGDSLYAEFKGKDGFSFRYDGFLWFNANELPHFRGDRGTHVYKRFAIICCDNIIPPEKQDRQLLDKIMFEKDIIASVAIDKFIKALKRGYKFSESERMKMNNKSYRIENNSLLTFISECCETCNTEARIKRSEFNEIYKNWCSANRVLPERAREIGKQLETYSDIKAHKSNGTYYYNLHIKEEFENEYNSEIFKRKY